MTLIATRMTAGFRRSAELELHIDWLEFVCWVVAMVHTIMAGKAEIIVIAACTVDKVVLLKYCHKILAWISCTSKSEENKPFTQELQVRVGTGLGVDS